MRALTALLLVLSPVAGLAEDEAAPPRWSLGAGISTTYIRLTGSSGGILGLSESPSGVASLERRLSDSNWLVLGVDGTVGDEEQELSGGVGTARSEYRRVALDLGLRHVLTRRGAVVDVSVLALAVGGYQAQHRTGWSVPDQDNSSWLLGGNVGLAVDRELTEGLSLRVATPIAGVAWERTLAEISGESLRGHRLTAGVFLAPRLELRLAF
jgi:hypothetical protein